MHYFKSLLTVALLTMSSLSFADIPPQFKGTGCVKKGVIYLKDGKEFGPSYKVGEVIKYPAFKHIAEYEGYLITLLGVFERDKSGVITFGGQLIESEPKVIGGQLVETYKKVKC